MPPKRLVGARVRQKTHPNGRTRVQGAAYTSIVKFSIGLGYFFVDCLIDE